MKRLKSLVAWVLYTVRGDSRQFQNVTRLHMNIPFQAYYIFSGPEKRLS